MSVSGKKVVVFGGFGFIGLNLLQKLILEGSQVTVLDTAKTIPLKNLESKIIYHQGDIRDSKLVTEILKDQEILFNLAGKSGPGNSMTDPKLDLEINCGGVLNILEIARETNPNLKIIFPGSRLEFGKVTSLPVAEDHPMRPTSIYGIHKLTAEKYHLAYADNFGSDTTVLRISNPYGPHLEQSNPGYNIINYFIDVASRNEAIKIYGDGSQRRDYLYIGDLVSLFLQLASGHDSKGEVYNVGSGKGVSLLEMAEAIIKVVGKGKIEHVAWDPELKKVETGDYVTDITKVKNQLNWQPETEIESGIEKTLTAQQDPYWKEIR